MSIDSLSQRPKYLHSGKVRWGRFFALLPLPLAIAAASAAALCWALLAGHYYSLMAPCFAALPVAGAVCLQVRWSHCRNVTIATLLGIFLGIVMYLEYFHVHRIALHGPAAIHRVDLLPQFIHWRMQTDVERDPDQPNQQNQQRPKPDVGYNWFHFGFELIAVSAIVGGAAASCASRGYCEACGSWMRSGLHIAPLGWAQRIAEHLAAGRLRLLPEIERKSGSLPGSSWVMVEACRHAGKNGNCCGYLTLHDKTAGGFFKVSKNTAYLNGVQIFHEELGWLSLKLAGLASLEPPGFEKTAALTEAATLPEATTAGLVPLPLAVAVVESLPSRHADHVYTTTNNTIACCLCLVPITSVLAGIGLLLAAWGLTPAHGPDTTVLSCVVFGAVLLLFGLVICYINIDYFGMQYGLWLTKNEIAMRPDAIVKPENPHAMWAEIIPRERWAKWSIERASDGGFLLVDEGNGQLLFEGIKQRYRIPSEAIIDCRSELMQENAGYFGMKLTVVQIHVARSPREGSESSVQELPFHRGITNFGHYSFALRRRWADELRDRILMLRSGNEARPTTIPDWDGI